jgi:hypothetical protein
MILEVSSHGCPAWLSCASLNHICSIPGGWGSWALDPPSRDNHVQMSRAGAVLSRWPRSQPLGKAPFESGLALRTIFVCR